MNSICAIIAVHNGEKTLDRVLEHFDRNSIDVQILDHGSSDRTLRIIEDRMGRPIIGHSRIEFDGIFRLREQLQHKEQIVRSLAHDWVIHTDADEIMESPLDGETLRGMIERQDRDGFDIIDCDEFVFVPQHDLEPADFVGEMKSYYFFSPTGRTLHRVQRVRGAILDWSTTGGHQLSTSGRCVATEKIRLRHYIGLTFDHLKSQYLGRVFDGSELAKGWHRNRVPMTLDFIVKPDPTRLFDIENDGWKTDQPEQKHLLFQQPHRYQPPAVLPKSSNREPFPFVIGVGRSGTTLLRLMIDAHPDIAITPESH